MALDIVSNKLDDHLSQLILENLNTEEQQIFIKSFKPYLEYNNDETAFVISFNDVWEWIAFSHKDNVRNLLIRNFLENIDYIEVFPEEESEKIMMNVNAFKEFCIFINTDKSKEVRKNYIKMENIMHQCIKEELLEHADTLFKISERFLEHEQKLLKISEERSCAMKKLDEAIEKNKQSIETFRHIHKYM